MSEGRRPLSELEQTTDFQRRHIGPGEAEIAAMLDALGLSSLDALIERTVPAAIRDEGPSLAGGRTEARVLADARALAARNSVFKSMIGMGYHDCHTPPVILRNVLENPGWYTAYTPYQPEISQGRFEALLNFQQMVIDLTGLDIANASLLDEGTAAAEAMTLMKRVSKNENETLFVAADCHPQTIAVVETRAEALGFKVQVGAPERDLDPAQVFGVLLQYPATDGRGARLLGARRARSRRRRAGYRGRRSARPGAVGTARRVGRRRGGGQRPALRRADVLRRAARRLPGDP